MPTQEVAPVARPAALVRRGGDRPHRVLLDGDADAWGDGKVRYSDTPIATLTCHASGWNASTVGGDTRWRWGDPFDAWQGFVDAHRSALGAGGGIASAFAYDLKHATERLPRRLPWPATPLLFAAAYDWSYRADRRGGRARLAAADGAGLARAAAWYASPDASFDEAGGPPALPAPLLDREDYGALVARVQAYIVAGDVYQVNLAQPFHAAATRALAPALYAAWTEAHPMPYAAYLDGGAWTLVSNSPECLLRLEGDRIATLPIKGTRRRQAGAAALVDDAKERAEHVMIVDLERNDLGRVCTPGSVEVVDLFTEREFPLLVHMVSEVRGRLRPRTPVADVLRALFPGGSITGAPKIRAMEIIEALEPAPRGFYTGAIGWTEPDGRTVLNLAIRTAVLDATGLCYWAGGGIVADSQAEREYAETLLKAEALVRAVGEIERIGP